MHAIHIMEEQKCIRRLSCLTCRCSCTSCLCALLHVLGVIRQCTCMSQNYSPREEALAVFAKLISDQMFLNVNNGQALPPRCEVLHGRICVHKRSCPKSKQLHNMWMVLTAKSAALRPISSRFRPAPLPDVPVHEEGGRPPFATSPFFPFSSSSFLSPGIFLFACSSLLDISLISRNGTPKLAHTLPIAAASISSQSVPNSLCTAPMELSACSQMSAEATMPLNTFMVLLLLGHVGNFIDSEMRWAICTKGGCDGIDRVSLAPTVV
mmetsp:Transcript_12360/g.17188  ORF Transcript_12360/g.17188 Transcript_12360/m.17188 type:complete len:266 (-) Transcript_12360:29-826(-)